MAIPAGSKGGIFGPLIDTGATIRDFAANVESYIYQNALQSIKTLGIYVNDRCNLSCKHCYYQIENGYSGSRGLSAEETIRVLRTAFAMDIKLFVFVGKEIFIPGPLGAEKTFSLMRFLSKAREGGKDFSLGAVTNGIFLDRVIDPLREVHLDFLDISFDGHDAQSHETIRGKRTFDKSTANLVKAITNSVAKKVFVASTLHKGNVHSLSEILNFHSRFGVRHFSVMPIVAVHDKSMSVSLKDLREFLSIHLPQKAASINLKTPVEFVMDIDSYVAHRSMEFLSAFFDKATVKIDLLNNIILNHDVDNLNLILRISLPDPFNYYGCITHDGLYFNKSGCLFMKEGYEGHTTGNVMDFDIDELIKKHQYATTAGIGCSSDIFAEVSDNYLNKIEETTFYEIPEIT